MSDKNSNIKQFEFKAEIKQLLNILVHSLYTHKEIFLRELISNASDALDKLRFELTRNTDIEDKDTSLEINIFFDEKKKIINVIDNGIGMTESEVIENIGTIAKSGTSEFLTALSKEQKDITNIIGKFGVGFYSVFMVAKEVVIQTKSFKNEPAVMWKSDGLGSYEINILDENIKRGTNIEIHLKDDMQEFLNKDRLISIVKTHSKFISFPIKVKDEQVNTQSAIWREPKSSLKKEQYD
ncbi:MAG: ATP-binding protein, partial [Ignavibacteriales bacterium]|nr:ATP-binding protein [Ignavibacteriales bacterium]